MTAILETIPSWRQTRVQLTSERKSIGFVPTMGALHEGHVSLIKRSQSENDVTVVSVFVNPTQFNDPKDFERYPKTFEKDLALLRSAGADFLFTPKAEEIYPNGFSYVIHEKTLSSTMEGRHRPGHFDGMLTVVMKLLQIIGAGAAYFGEKDFQQLQLVQGMARDFFLPTKIIGCPTLRAVDGLALSSRNSLLSESERRKAPAFHQVFSDPTVSPEQAAQKLRGEGFEIDYIEDHDGRRFGAVRLGNVRLIDNVKLKGMGENP